jgi:hypothetical protein
VFGRARPRDEQTWFLAASRERVRCMPQRGEGAGWEFAARQLLGGA